MNEWGHFCCAEEQRLSYWSSTEAYTCLMALAHSAHAQWNKNVPNEHNLAQRHHPEAHSQADPVHTPSSCVFVLNCIDSRVGLGGPGEGNTQRGLTSVSLSVAGDRCWIEIC